MIIIRKIENRLVILTITLFVVIFISFLDYITGSELSFSIFYLIPITFLALYRNTGSFSVLICSIFASLLWFIVEYKTREYSNIFFPIWNSFVRLTMFTAIGLLLLYLKEKDKKLNQINQDLKTLNEEKNKFIGIAAHDLKNPISGIYSFSELLIANCENNIHPAEFKILNYIKEMSDNTLVILKNLLDVSKIESGKVELKITTQDYISFVKQKILMNQLLAKNKNITIHLDSPKHNFNADFDKHYLSEVIDNLLSNAIKYSNKKSEIIVKISLHENNQILTEVIDKGIGIAEGDQQKLFKYFQTTSTRPTAGEQSTGLGLAIAKHIIKLHNGEIGVKSNQNEGSNFYFLLPIKNKMN
jgi:signal transduction histidine kinase